MDLDVDDEFWDVYEPDHEPDCYRLVIGLLLSSWSVVLMIITFSYMVWWLSLIGIDSHVPNWH